MTFNICFIIFNKFIWSSTFMLNASEYVETGRMVEFVGFHI